MHILETYSLVTAQKISKCFIHEESINIPLNKYITFHGFHKKGSSRQYKSWQKIIDLLNNNNKFNYEIVQIGEINDLKYNNINNDFLGKTNVNSLAFLINNSELHFGYDSFPVHLASHFQKKIVAIYPHFSKSSGPFFSNEKDIKIIEPYYNKIGINPIKLKPCFAYNDKNDLINTIDPNEIYESILNLLKIND